MEKKAQRAKLAKEPLRVVNQWWWLRKK